MTQQEVVQLLQWKATVLQALAVRPLWRPC
jgi:hypothetical protein